MMKRLVVVLALLFGAMKGEALSDFAEIYPPVMQELVGTDQFRGDRHGDFWGDSVAVLSDGSAWKVHPESEETYRTWLPGEVVRVIARTDFYWFKREHKFALYNANRNQFAKVMLVCHKEEPLTIVGIDTYHKGYQAVYNENTYEVRENDGSTRTHTEHVFSHYVPADFRKILFLSDGSVWVIRENLSAFQLGMRIYVGAQGRHDAFYDFVLIGGDQREAVWTWARPQK